MHVVRGVAKHGAVTFTSRFTRMFRDNPAEQRVSCPWCEGRRASPQLFLRGLTVSTPADINDIEEGLKFQPKIRLLRPCHLRRHRRRQARC